MIGCPTLFFGIGWPTPVTLTGIDPIKSPQQLKGIEPLLHLVAYGNFYCQWQCPLLHHTLISCTLRVLRTRDRVRGVIQYYRGSLQPSPRSRIGL